MGVKSMTCAASSNSGEKAHMCVAWISECKKVISFTRRPEYDPLVFSTYDQLLEYVVFLGRQGYGII